ncbi:MAG: alpha/beta fold hydrolase [Leptolyngbya sp. SIO4C1]|nr:alpha/beta fold hydrolase [Leptolyngbya sp. SIO4C1]
MASYSEIKAKIEQNLATAEAHQPLLDQAFKSHMQLHDAPTEKVCLFFHGFTAGPYQFMPLGQTMYRAGYNVLVPLLPGHGLAGDWTPHNPPPLTRDPHIYLRFALHWLTIAQQLGQRVVIGGLSGGGTLAAWLALEKAEAIHRALLFAPYFSASSKVIDLFVEHIDTYFQWEKLLGPAYPGFEIEALRAILRIADYNFSRIKKTQSAPFFIISSESDRAVDNLDHRHYFEYGLKRQPYCWHHCFDRVLDIPHTMMTEAEGNRYINLLNVMAKAFIESNLTWAEVEEIAYRMTKGRTFNAVIAELGWQDRASPDMPAMITLVDKWSIVVKRQMRLQRGRRSRRLKYDR